MRILLILLATLLPHGCGSSSPTEPTSVRESTTTVAETDPFRTISSDPALDVDGDGWSAEEGDCDDGDPGVNPGVSEICGDARDNNCNGQRDEGCGFGDGGGDGNGGGDGGG